jgi:hypothetical protein
MTKLVFIKVIHTVIWVFFNVVLFYLLFLVINNKISKEAWFCIGIIMVECLVLVAFKGMCPLTLAARKYSDSDKDNFDIYLPNWLARHNKLIYSILFVIIIIILIVQMAKAK